MTTFRVWAIPINPEPWAMGDIKILRRKNNQPWPKVTENKNTAQYQRALKSELTAAGAEVEEGMYSLKFTFSHQLEQYLTPKGRTQTRNAVDVTNMQKATEDAMQGVAIANDSASSRVLGQLYGPQRTTTMPFVVIECISGLTWDHPRTAWNVPSIDNDGWLSREAKDALNMMMTSSIISPVVNLDWTPE